MEVIKVGGSLFSLRDLAVRVNGWLERFSSGPSILIAGGGPTADLVRQSAAELTEADAHWLAIRAMSFHAHLLAGQLKMRVTDDPRVLDARQEPRVVLDPLPFLHARPNAMPIGWEVTSDSIAGFIAQELNADRLVLMKSVGGDEPITVAGGVERGWVDPYFPTVSQSLSVLWVNLRTNQAAQLTR